MKCLHIYRLRKVREHFYRTTKKNRWTIEREIKTEITNRQKAFVYQPQVGNRKEKRPSVNNIRFDLSRFNVNSAEKQINALTQIQIN